MNHLLENSVDAPWNSRDEDRPEKTVDQMRRDADRLFEMINSEEWKQE